MWLSNEERAGGVPHFIPHWSENYNKQRGHTADGRQVLLIRRTRVRRVSVLTCDHLTAAACGNMLTIIKRAADCYEQQPVIRAIVVLFLMSARNVVIMSVLT